MSKKILILGAGPAGLTFALRAIENGCKDVLVLEAQDEAGGLCRSREVCGSELDIGGGHFLDVRRPNVTTYLFRFMPESEWNLFERDSRINLFDRQISHPLEANIWQLAEADQIDYLKSIFSAGCNSNERMPDAFVDWIRWKLGDRIAEDYMLPYNAKMFGSNLNSLGTYWLSKLPNVSFDETLLSCLRRAPLGEQPGHARFYYPKSFGYGEVWRRMSAALGNKLILNQKVDVLDIESRTVLTTDGTSYSADIVINTTPWVSMKLSGIKPSIADGVNYLKHNSITVKYIDETYATDAHWIYEPSPAIDHHRYLLRHNFLPGARGYWTEANSSRDGDNASLSQWSHRNDFAYPLNTQNKPEAVDRLLTACQEKNVFGLGRWGEHEHYNSDVTVEKALALSDRLTT